MDSHELIDAQFDRAVEIIQSLPKTGPIQTGYEEKLTMYSLYKQATVGNVKSPRPGIFDMLGRAKWDAWAKHKDLESYEAKWLYVDALLKVLRKYSDKTMARDLVRELESFEGDPSNIMMSGSLSRPHESDSSSEASDRRRSTILQPGHLPPHFKNNTTNPQLQQEVTTSDEETSDEEEAHIPPVPSVHEQSLANRPQSSLSSHRYRTPMAGSLLMTSPPIPETQPMPGFSTPSAFAGPSTPSRPASSYNHPSSYSDQYSHASQEIGPQYLAQPAYRGPGPMSAPPVRQYALHQTGMTPRPPSRIALERALENMQAHIAALTERIDILESRPTQSWGSYPSPGRGSSSPFRNQGRGSPSSRPGISWTNSDLGLWSLVIQAISRVAATVRHVATIVLRDEGLTPTWMIVRRLFLDISFILCVLGLFKSLWRRTGIRRREINVALGALVRAVIGTRPPRAMVERGV
ncbi:ACBP-domain-containing protein [Dentipellis sp. KUC8613]|nr:ACBP-domain-containing protein [Dentipellis sp. KUC8613]